MKITRKNLNETMNENSFSYLLRLGFGESWDFFLTKMNGCHTKFLLSSDIYKTYFSRTQMIILCPRYNLLKKLISVFFNFFQKLVLGSSFPYIFVVEASQWKKKNLYHNQFVILKRKNKIQLYYSYYYYLLLLPIIICWRIFAQDC